MNLSITPRKQHRKELLRSSLLLVESTIEACISEAKTELNAEEYGFTGLDILADVQKYTDNPLREEVRVLEQLLEAIRYESTFYNLR